MAKKKMQIDVNTAQTRLEDCKREYNFNNMIIKRLMNDIENEESLIVYNGNNTQSASPSLRTYQDLISKNVTLTKLINEMEEAIRSGSLKDEDEEDPFA